ncbi:hypothetical protein ACFOQM_07985 [Paenibacillus sp. GCM10012307]|uniref:FlgD Ig-like domain-containing protein n=1 Tax=Paenibacillus roseus TaxID=2798579 RepID=A0A934J0U1_9BACL|nr:hypothetical protein [Paenibacillus roseus]MBJ6361229.1 hypothetical protein [Paenibacillus roseus]
MKKLNFILLVMVMLFTFTGTAFANQRVTTGTYTHSGGNLQVNYFAYDSHVHGFLTVNIYKVTASGDVFITSFNEEGGRPGHDIHQGSWSLGNQPAGTYKYVATVPDAWMGPSIWFS